MLACLGHRERERTNVAEPRLPTTDYIAARFGITKDAVCAWIAEKAVPARIKSGVSGRSKPAK